MKLFSRISLLFIAAAVFPAAFLHCANTPVVENQYDYLTEGYAQAQAARFFNVNTDEMGPALFMVAQGSFWTIKDVQNALLSLEVMSDTRQINKVFNDLKKFVAQGAEKHLEESLLKNTLAATFRGLGQQGHVLTDFPDWRVCVDGIAPAFTHDDVVAWVKGFIDPWVIAPKSKTIILSKQLTADQRAAAITQRKKFEEIPFPFLYRLKEAKANAGLPIKKTLWYAALLFGAWRVQQKCSARLADYNATVKDPEASAPVVEVSQQNCHLVGPAVAMYCLDPSTRPVERDGSLTLDVKRPKNVDCHVDGAFWTFEQFAKYKKELFGSSQKLKSLHTALFGAGQPSVELMQYQMDCVFKLLVPSVDYDPCTKWAQFSALFNKDRAFLHASENGKELRWLYRWAWFFARTDVNKQCEPSLLGADLTAEDIPKKSYAEVEGLIQESMRDLKIEPTPFNKVKNDDSLIKRSVVFRDPRRAASAQLLTLLELYHDHSPHKLSRLFSGNLYHQMPFWDVLLNTATEAGGRSPLMFDGITIKSLRAESSHLDHFVIAARAQHCYPYSYFGFSPFLKKSKGEAGAGSGSTASAVPGATTGSRNRRAHSAGAPARAASVEYAYRTDPHCKVCDVTAFYSRGDEARWARHDSEIKYKSIVRVTQDGNILFVGAPFTSLSAASAQASEDILIFQPAKCTAEQTAAFDQRKQNLQSWYSELHPADIAEQDLSFSPQEASGLWLNLTTIARNAQCTIEMCTTFDSATHQYRVYLCCATPVDAQKVKALPLLKDSGLISVTP